MSIEKLETNPEQFKVNKVGLSRRNKLALQNSNTFDCQDCYNVITTYQNPNELIFANALTGLTNTVQMPSGYSAQGHIAKFDNTFWINGGAIINEFTIGANCNITHVRTIDISSLSSLPVGAWEVNGLCAMDMNTLVIGTFVDINNNEGVHLIDITPGAQPSTTHLFDHNLIPNHPGGPIAGDIAYLPTSNTLVTITGTSNSTFTAYHHDMSGGLLGSSLVVTNPLQTGAAGPFNAWSFDDKAYLSTVNNPGGQNYVTYEFDLTSYTLIPHTPTVIGYGDAASSPSPCAQSSNECYDIGDTGPGGGIIFSVPLGHPQNNGVNQTNFYYEVAKNDINVGGSIPSSIYNQSCGDLIKQVVTVDAGWFSQNIPNAGNTQDITFDFGPGTANPSFDPQNLNIGATVQALDAQGNNMFPPNTTVTVTNKTFFPSTPNIVLVEFDTPLNVLPNGVQLLSTQIATVKFGITIVASGVTAAGNEFGAYDKTIQTSIDFGTGQDNTNTIHSYPITPGIHPTLSSRQIAATECLNHSSTGTYLGQPFTAGDWFLPSLGEFEEIQNQMMLGNIPSVSFKPVNTQTHEHVYWTSSAFRDNQFTGFTMPGPDRWAWVYRSTSSGPMPIVPNLAFRCHPLSVRPIRRFECTPPPCPDAVCSDVEYNYRDGYCGRIIGSFCSSSWNGRVSDETSNIPPSSIIAWGTTNQGCTAGSSITNESNYDSVIGGDCLRIIINKTDVLGNFYTPADFRNAASGYKITVWDTNYNFVGKWKYDVHSISDTNDPNGYTYDSPNSITVWKLNNGQHLQGNYPIVSYSGYYDDTWSGIGQASCTGFFFKIEWDGAISYETGCNSTVFGNPHPYYTPSSPVDFAAYCGPLYNVYDGSYTNINTAIPRVATFPPVDLQGNTLQVFPDFHSALPNYPFPHPGFYPNASTLSTLYGGPYQCVCDYQVGDTGPAGGIIVATPYMNAGSITPNGAAANNSNYYFEVAPNSIGNFQWGSFGADVISPSNNNSPYEAQGMDNMNTFINNWSPILTSPPGSDNAFDLCKNYILNNHSDWFLPSVEELWFVRNNLPPNIISNLVNSTSVNTNLTRFGFFWTSNTIDDYFGAVPFGSLSSDYLPLSTYIEYYTAYTQPGMAPNITALAVDISTNITTDLTTGAYTIGDFIAASILRYSTAGVLPMRKFTCSNNTPIVSPSRRQKFKDKSSVGINKRPKETGPFAILGYFPLYDTVQGAINNSPESSYHIHQFGNKAYYMPNGLEMDVTQFHGNYKPEVKKFNIENFVEPDVGISIETTVELPQVEQEYVETVQEAQIVEPIQELPSVVTITPIEPEQEEEPPAPSPTPTPTPTYTPPPSTPSGGSGGGGY